MRIAFSGTQCTGKSVLINELKGNSTFFNDYTFFDEVVRKLVKETGIKINKDFDTSSQLIIFSQHMINILTPNGVCDRCILDAFVYAYFGYKQGKFTDSEFKVFENIFLSYVDLYDIIFYLPIEFALQNDGFRSKDEDFRNQIEMVFQFVMDHYKLTNVIWLTGDVDKRKRQVLIHSRQLQKQIDDNNESSSNF